MMRRVKSVMMKVPEWVPSRPGSASNSGAAIPYADEQLLHEQGMPGILGNDLNRQPVMRVRPGIQIQDIQVALPHVGHHPGQQGFKPCRIEGLVDLAPIHAVTGDRIANDKFVPRGTSGSCAGQGYQRAIVSQTGFAPGNGRLYQLGGRQVAVDVGPFHQLSRHCGCLD
jgi:hypothetical protein